MPSASANQQSVKTRGPVLLSLENHRENKHRLEESKRGCGLTYETIDDLEEAKKHACPDTQDD